jgi:hypothetical protein
MLQVCYRHPFNRYPNSGHRIPYVGLLPTGFHVVKLVHIKPFVCRFILRFDSSGQNDACFFLVLLFRMVISKSKAKSKSHYDRQLVGQSVLVSGAHLGPATNISISLRFSFGQLLFVML